MRYMCLPGQLELKIQKIAEKCGCGAELWPDRDKYDVKITLPDGQVWAIDAKTHRNPYMLKRALKMTMFLLILRRKKSFMLCLTIV